MRGAGCRAPRRMKDQPKRGRTSFGSAPSSRQRECRAGVHQLQPGWSRVRTAPRPPRHGPVQTRAWPWYGQQPVCRHRIRRRGHLQGDWTVQMRRFTFDHNETPRQEATREVPERLVAAAAGRHPHSGPQSTVRGLRGAAAPSGLTRERGALPSSTCPTRAQRLCSSYARLHAGTVCPFKAATHTH